MDVYVVRNISVRNHHGLLNTLWYGEQGLIDARDFCDARNRQALIPANNYRVFRLDEMLSTDDLAIAGRN